MEQYLALLCLFVLVKNQMLERLFYWSTAFPAQIAEKESDMCVSAGMFFFGKLEGTHWRRHPLIQLQKGNGGRCIGVGV